MPSPAYVTYQKGANERLSLVLRTLYIKLLYENVSGFMSFYFAAIL